MTTPLRILIVEDSEDDALLLVREFQRSGYEPAFETVQTLEAMSEALDRETWDVILSDHNMPGFNSLAALELYNRKELDVPFIIVSGAIDEEIAIDAMKAGAHDYVMKDRLARLVPSVERELRESTVRKNKRRADLALKESEQRLRTLFDRHQAVMLLIDPDSGAITDANPAACRFYGYTHHELKSMNIAEINLLPPEEIAEIRRTAGNEEQNYFVSRHRLAGGEVRTVEVYATPVEVQGQVQLFSIVHDITERQKAEDRIRQIAEEWMTTFDSISDLIFILDRDRKIVRVNKAYGKAMKANPEDLIGRYCYEVLQGTSCPVARCPHEQVLRTKEPFSGEVFEPRPGLYFELSASPIFDREGSVTGSVHVAKNITGPKRAEERMRESEDKYRSIFENATEGIFQTTTEGRLISINPAMAHTYGYTSPEEMMMSVTDIGKDLYVNQEERTRYRQIIEEHGKVTAFETEFIRKDGSRMWGSINSHAVKDGQGRILYIEGSVEDVTERVATEKRFLREMEWKKTLLFAYERASQMSDKELYDYFLEQAVRLTDSTVGFLHLVSDNQTVVILATWSRGALKDCATRHKTHYPIDQAGSWVDCVRLRRPVVYNDFSSSPNRKGFPEGHVPVFRFMSVPAMEEDKVRMIFGLGNKAEEYSEDDIMQAQLLATDLHTIIRQRKTEEARSQSERRYRSIFENAVEGIFQTLPNGRFITINPSLAQMHGFESPEEMIASVTDVSEHIYVHPEDRERYAELLEEKGAISGFEVEFRRKDGTALWASVDARAVRDEAGKTLYYEGTVENITSRKAAEREVQETLLRLRRSLVGTIHAISSVVETRDPYTAGHQQRVSRLARSIAQEMGLSRDAVDCIRMAGAIHDIGKMAVPAEILSKPGRITDIEMNLIRIHPESGYDILRDAELPYPIAEIVLQHHERLDGSGYPHGLKGTEILLEAQIIGVADVVEAIASHRPYRPAFGIDPALEELERNKGILYNTDVVEACIRLFREKEFYFD